MKDTIEILIGDMQRDINNCEDDRFSSGEEIKMDKAVAEALKHYYQRLIKINGELVDKK